MSPPAGADPGSRVRAAAADPPRCQLTRQSESGAPEAKPLHPSRAAILVRRVIILDPPRPVAATPRGQLPQVDAAVGQTAPGLARR